MLVLAIALSLAANPELQKAESLFEQLKYPEATKAALKALTVPENDRATVIRTYELLGLIDATTGKKTALDYFRRLVALDPDHALSRDLGPRILQPFYEAKGRLDENPALQLSATAALSDDGVQQLHVSVSADPLKLVTKLALHWKNPEGAWQSKVEPVKAGGFTITAESDSVDWYARALGAYDGVLLESGTAEQPLEARPKAATTTTTPIVRTDPVVVEPAPAPGMPLLRKVGLGAAAAGVVALGLSAGFGLSSSGARNQVMTRMTTPLAPERYEALQSQAVDHAVVANTLLGAGLVLAGAGAALFFIGGRSSAPVALVPSGPGVALVGDF